MPSLPLRLGDQRWSCLSPSPALALLGDLEGVSLSLSLTHTHTHTHTTCAHSYAPTGSHALSHAHMFLLPPTCSPLWTCSRAVRCARCVPAVAVIPLSFSSHLYLSVSSRHQSPRSFALSTLSTLYFLLLPFVSFHVDTPLPHRRFHMRVLYSVFTQSSSSLISQPSVCQSVVSAPAICLRFALALHCPVLC